MLVGAVREIKSAESRVGLTPAGVRALVRDGHSVLVERGAGIAAGFADEAYAQSGARLVEREEAWASSDLVVKVKEPLREEFGYLRKGLTLFTYLHLAANRPLTEVLLSSGVAAYGYETVRSDTGGLPLLAPMSEIAGRLAALAAAHYLMAPFGGPGTLVGGAPGVPGADVVVIGGGVVGAQAALIATGMQARVAVLEASGDRVRQLTRWLPRDIDVVLSDDEIIGDRVRSADVVIGAVLLPGALAPKVLRRSSLGALKPGALLIDVSIDQGGCFESSRPTSYDAPLFELDGVLHYCVTNMPGAVPRTSTRALTAATLPYLRRLAGHASKVQGCTTPDLDGGLNVSDGALRHPAVAGAFPDLVQAAETAR